ncbi:MAG: hypothetical protein ACK4L7_10560 [Flavobacteriales bacterium]
MEAQRLLTKVAKAIEAVQAEETRLKERIALAKSRRAYRRKPGRRKKRTVVGGYRLNAWDNMVVAAVTKADRPLAKRDLMDMATAWAKKEEPRLKAADVEPKLTRTLQKLSGKRGLLGKHRTGLQRGVHYGLTDWFFHGKLRRDYLDKVDVQKD